MKRMKSGSSISMVFMVAVFGTGLMQEALASCDTNDRMAHGDSECLRASWENNVFSKWFVKYGSRFEARNECSGWGKVVVKWDMDSAADRTWHLNDDNTRNGHSDSKVSWAYCCTDLSDLCNVSDMLTNKQCRSEFHDSDAHDDGCRLDSGSDGASISDDTRGYCDISATCPANAGASTKTSGSWHVLKVDQLVNCDGELEQEDECG